MPGICECEIIFPLQVLMVSAYVAYKKRKGQLCPSCPCCWWLQEFIFKRFFFGRHDICKGINEPCETLGKENNNHFLQFWQPVSCLIESRYMYFL